MAMIAYTANRPNCKLCHLPAFGAFAVEFSTGYEELACLCAECGLTRAWVAYKPKQIKALRLEAIFKFPLDKVAPPPKPILPEATDFVASEYNATFIIEGDVFTGPLDPCEGSVTTFATEWAALERARQISQNLARGIKKHNHWDVQTGITRLTKGAKNGTA